MSFTDGYAKTYQKALLAICSQTDTTLTPQEILNIKRANAGLNDETEQEALATLFQQMWNKKKANATLYTDTEQYIANYYDQEATDPFA